MCCCSVLQCVAVWFEVDLMCCCSVLQCVAVWFEVDLMCSQLPLQNEMRICVLSENWCIVRGFVYCQRICVLSEDLCIVRGFVYCLF